MATAVAPLAAEYAVPNNVPNEAPGMVPPTHARAVVFDAPGALALRALALAAPTDADVVVDVEWSGVSAGTERLFWRGTMPPFPGMGYPLVPGYETVGRVRWAGAASGRAVGERVFVPGAHGFQGARNLFGGAGETLVVPGARTHAVGDASSHQLAGEEGVLLALAATAMHAVRDGERPGAPLPDLIVGHGALGRLAARLVLALGGPPPTVWELDEQRAGGAEGYAVVHPDTDARRDYRRAMDASGAVGILDTLVGRLAPGGEIVLAGFYTAPLAFAFIPAFLRGIRLRVAAEFRPADLADARDLVLGGRLSLAGVVTHRARIADGEAAIAAAYATAFDDPSCVKMVLDWSPRNWRTEA
ncbi:MAG TPA: chlorophyll synthesis pathway protein BchC [Gemmatirosa sp.]